MNDSIESIFDWLSGLQKEWLLVFDNADGDTSLLDSLIPSGGRANILISSRNPNLRYRVPSDGAMEVSEMGLDDAKMLLSRVSNLGDDWTAEVDAKLASIAAELYFIPLALDHAGSAILCEFCTWDDYQQMLRKYRKSLLANPQFHGSSGYNRTLYSTWSLTTTLLEDRVRNVPTEFSQESAAILLLNILGFVHHSSIMEDIFCRAAESRIELLKTSSDKEILKVIEHLPESILKVDDNGKWNPVIFRKATMVLRSMSLVRRDKTSSSEASFSIHPEVHFWSRERLSDEERTKAYLTIHAILSTSIRHSSSKHDIRYCRKLVPHLAALRNSVEWLRAPELYFDNCHKSFGQALFVNGLFVEAKRHATWEFQLAHRYLGENHPFAMQAASRLSGACRELGDFLESEKILRTMLVMAKKAFGGEDSRTLEAMASLAATLTSLSKLEESEILKQEIAEIRSRKLGENHPDTLMALSNLAATYCQQKRWKEAETIIMDVTKRRVEVLGSCHPETLRGRLVFTVCLMGQGRFEEAECQCKQVVDGRREALGEEHAYTLWSMHKLAEIWENLGRTPEAIELWEKTVSLQLANPDLGSGHWETKEVQQRLTFAREKLKRE